MNIYMICTLWTPNFRLKGTEKFIRRDSLNSPLIYILFSMSKIFKSLKMSIHSLKFKIWLRFFLPELSLDFLMFFFLSFFKTTSQTTCHFQNNITNNLSLSKLHHKHLSLSKLYHKQLVTFRDCISMFKSSSKNMKVFWHNFWIQIFLKNIKVFWHKLWTQNFF